MKFLLSRKDPLWHTPDTIDNSRVFSVLSILIYLLRIIAPHSKWKQRMFSLMQKYDKIPLSVMGFYDGWTDNELWKDLN